MSIARSLRRAAERKAQKQARKEAQQTANLPALFEAPEMSEIDEPEPEPEICPAEPAAPTPVSEAKRHANQVNAQLSTGPRTPQGKAASSKNAVKTALTGRTVLLPGDDAERYAARLAHYEKIYQPVGVREIEVVQAMCDAWWRLERIPTLIEALYVKGCNELNDRLRDVDPEAQLTMLRLEAHVVYERTFRNLELQERRLFRQFEKLQAELKQLQKERDQREAEQYAQAAMFYLAAKKDRKPFHPSDFGFDFTVSEIETYLETGRARQIADEHFAGQKNNPNAAQRRAG